MPSFLCNPIPDFKGVRKRGRKCWGSEIRIPRSRKKIWLGSFTTPQLAARAFDAAYLLLRGPSATATKLNFPDSPCLIHPHLMAYTHDDGGQASPQRVQGAAAAIANTVAEAEDQDTDQSQSGMETEGGPPAGEDREGHTDNGSEEGVFIMGSGWTSNVFSSLVSPGLISPRSQSPHEPGKISDESLRRASAHAAATINAVWPTTESSHAAETADSNRVQRLLNMENILPSASSDDDLLQQTLLDGLVQDGFTPVSLAVTTRVDFDTDVIHSIDSLWGYPF